MSIIKKNAINIIGNGSKNMMFAHGFGCDQNMWRFITPAFLDNFKIILFDLVGSGNSDLSAYNFNKYSTLQGHADDVIEICEELELSDVTFVGHSVGAMIGALVVKERPALFETLIMVGPSPCYINQDDYIGGFSRDDINELLLSIESNFLGWVSDMTPVIVGNEERPELAEEVKNSFCRNDPKIAKHFARVAFMSDHRNDLKAIEVNTLILQYSSDIIVPVEVGEHLHEIIKTSKLKVIQGTGHFPHLSSPEEIINKIKDFIILNKSELNKKLMAFDYKEFYDDSPIGYFSTNTSGIIINANQFFLKLIQREADKVINKLGLQDFLSIDGKINFQTHYLPVLQNVSKVKDIRLEILRSDKTKVPILINTNKSDKIKESPTFHSVVFEISQHSLFVRELIESKNKAERRIEKLTKLQRQMVIQSNIIKKQNKSLDRLNSVKDKFFSIIAHDIRGPLNSLASFVGLIRNHIDSLSKEDLKKMTFQMSKSLSTTVDLTDDLFSWAESQMKEYGVSPIIFSVESAVSDVIRNHIPVAEKKQLKLSYAVDTKQKINVDKNQFHFILRNLLMNAIKFTPSGGSIKIHSYQAEDNKIKIAITDNGVGISERRINAIFENNMKASNVGTEGEKGHGIGLLLVKEFVQMNNGNIEVFSKKDEGTTFLITFDSVY